MELPSGNAYTIKRDSHGNLDSVTMPTSATHSFAQVTTMGFRQIFYTPPDQAAGFVIDLFDDGRLKHIKMPSDEKRCENERKVEPGE